MITTNNNLINKWLNYKVVIENNLLTRTRLKHCFNTFWDSRIATNLNENNAALVQLKVLFTDKRVRSISYVQSVDIHSRDKLFENFFVMWSLRDEEYQGLQLDSLIFNYKFPKVKNKTWNLVKINEPQSFKKVNKPVFNSTKISSYSIPNTMELNAWGAVVYIHELNRARIERPKSKAVYEVKLSEDRKTHIIDITVEGDSVLQFKDILESIDKPTTFKRIFKGKVYYYKEGALVFKQIERKCKFLTKVKRSSHISKKIITLDIETRTLQTLMSPYCISVFDGVIKKSFYLSGYSDPESMLKEAIFFLMRKKYHQFKVYIHNFSHFDGVFLIGVLSSLSNNIKPIIKDGRIIDLAFAFGEQKTKYKLFFRDSYLLLPDSLRRLAINFKVENKGLFPYRFVNDRKIPLDYKGAVPAFEFFDNISQAEYKEYCKEFKSKAWDLQAET